MSALTMDTLAISQILRKRGFTADQATGVVEAFREIDGFSLATKADLREVEMRIEVRTERVEAKIEGSAANLKVELLRKLVVTQIAVAGFIFAAIKFVK